MNKPQFFDIHSHLNFKDFNDDRDEIIKKMKEKKIWTITVGTDKKTSEEAIKLAEQEDFLFATVGLHPNAFKEGFNFDDYLKLAQHSKVVAIGECGLDYFRTKETDENKQNQKKLFRQHIELSLKVNKPLMIHCREAYVDLLNILSEYKENPNLRGNVHFFVGNKEIAKKFLDLGFTLSFTGVITFTHDYDEVVEMTPLNMIMTETDSPYVAPVPHRGKTNKPLYVEEVVKKIAEIKKEDIKKVSQVLIDNSLRVFNIQ